MKSINVGDDIDEVVRVDVGCELHPVNKVVWRVYLILVKYPWTIWVVQNFQFEFQSDESIVNISCVWLIDFSSYKCAKYILQSIYWKSSVCKKYLIVFEWIWKSNRFLK